MSSRLEKGRAGEDAAADYLLRLGYTLITRRFKVRQGEIDLICLDQEVIVFVEVKTRYAEGYVPEEGVGSQKLSRLQQAAAIFLKRNEETRPYRFDVIAIDRDGLRHHRHIFGH